MDLVLPYVNAADREWQQSILRTTKTAVSNSSSVRFRSWGTLKYLFRGVAQYMPFIDRIVLIVASKSQVPVWINYENVRIVYHDEFIPSKFLPTFNSCTIESFLYNIEGLSDRFIYANDDIFAINPCSIDDFFTEDVPHIKYVIHDKYTLNNTFRCQCRSGMDLIMSKLNTPEYEQGYIIRPYHITSPMTTECLSAVKQLCGNDIENTVSRLREPRNINQYIYLYYQYFMDNYVDSIVSYKYYTLSDKFISDICKAILGRDYKLVCLNDSGKVSDYSALKSRLLSAFKQKFPNRCKYEN
jgi:hypothetical protein